VSLLSYPVQRWISSYAFGRVIRDDFCFDIFKVVSWRPGGVSDDESTERFRNTVTVEFSFVRYLAIEIRESEA